MLDKDDGFLPAGMSSFDCEHQPEKIAIVSDGSSFTYAQLRKRVQTISRFLNSRRPGAATAALFLRSGVDLISAYLACLNSGASAVPINPRSTVSELEYLLANTEATLLLVHRDQHLHLSRALSSVHTGLIVSIEDILEMADSGALEQQPQTRQAAADSKCAVIFHTSGSTERPKGVMYAEKTLMNAVRPFLSKPFVDRYGTAGSDFVYLSTASVSDTVGIIHILWTLILGGTAVVMQSFDVDRYIDALVHHRPTHSTLFLPQVAKLLSCNRLKRQHFDSVRVLFFAGDRTPVGMIQRWIRSTGIVPLIGYGLTESFVVTLNLSQSPAKFGSIGQPVEGVTLKIVNENDDPTPPGLPGEIVVTSPQNMIGYWREPEETNRVCSTSNWLRTGDLGYFDEEGFVWFVGRKKQIIIRGGENISPLEIEHVLQLHPAVSLACVVGFPHPIEGEVPQAFLVFRDGCVASEADLRAHVAEYLIDFKIPTDFRIVESLPTTRTGKIDRQNLRAQLIDDKGHFRT
jgi:acyl-CoA synthetase (AMP-forming)/AMP-acid ligase II